MMFGASSQTPSSRSLGAIFISHATEDRDFVRTLVEHLRQKGFETWHQLEMTVGGNYMSEIDVRLDSCKAGIVVWSRSSVTSEYVKAEANRLRERECLVPVYIEDCKPPIVFGLIQGIKCRNPRNLTTEEVLALCEAIRKLLILGSKGELLAVTTNVFKTTMRSKIQRALSTLQVQQLLIGIILGALLGYTIFQWFQSVAKADLDGFIKSAGTVPPEGLPLAPDTKFPDSDKPITFARIHIPQSNGWAMVIVDHWQEHYEAQKRIAMMYCHTLNNVRLIYRQRFLASRKAAYLKQENSKTSPQLGQDDTAQTAAINFNPVLLEILKSSRCPGDEVSSPPIDEVLMSELDQ
jgi:hypothetical protein